MSSITKKLKKKRIQYPEVGKDIKPIKESSKFSLKYKLKNVDNLTFFKYMTIISFIAMAGCFCLLFTAYRSPSNIYEFIGVCALAPFGLQTLYLLALCFTNDFFKNKNWLQKPFFKTNLTKSQVLLIILDISVILMNGGVYKFEAGNLMFVLMLIFTAIAFFETGNIALGIAMNSLLKLFEYLTLVGNIPLVISMTIITILPFLLYSIYRRAVKKDSTSS